MSDEPTDPPANEADDSEPHDSDADASTGTGDTQITIPDGLGHLITGFLSSITPDDFGNPGTWSFPYHHPRPPVVVSPNRALQNYLLQVQALAGIPPQQANPMESARPSRRGTGPVMLYLGDDGCRLAIVPPATFNGTLWPLFIREPRPATAERSNDGDSDGTTEGSPRSDSSGRFEMPDASDDIEVYMDTDALENTDAQVDTNTQEDMDTQEDGSQES
ncbi:hypothetical protein PoHVEF18_003257 [Penicillium ochrochloron]